MHLKQKKLRWTKAMHNIPYCIEWRHIIAKLHLILLQSYLLYYLSFHYGYRRNSDGTRDYSKKLSSEDYRLLYQDEVDIFNKYINKTKIIIEMVDRFVIRGRNSKYDIDVETSLNVSQVISHKVKNTEI